MKEICPEFNVNGEEFCGENRETYWKNIFDFKRLRVSKQKLFTGMIETDGVAMCVHYRRLKKDRQVPPSAAPLTKHEGEKEADSATQEVQDNDLVVDAARHEDEKKADPVMQEVEGNDLVVRATKHQENEKAGSEKRRCRITTLSLTRRTMKKTRSPVLRSRKCKITTLSLARTPETQISSPSQHRSGRKIVLTATYVRKTCVS